MAQDDDEFYSVLEMERTSRLLHALDHNENLKIVDTLFTRLLYKGNRLRDTNIFFTMEYDVLMDYYFLMMRQGPDWRIEKA